ncbi:hypothetical protein AAC387_Pa01g3232 [Persea americana]
MQSYQFPNHCTITDQLSIMNHQKAESNKQRRNPRNQDIMFVGLLPSLTSHRCNRYKHKQFFSISSYCYV